MSSGEAVAGRFVGDRYHLVRELGRGGMGVVWLARDLRREMDVAIKFRVRTHHDGTVWLKREFRAVASLRHPNLVELYELNAYERSCYFTMEYVAGVDPLAWVKHPRAPSPSPSPSVPAPIASNDTTRTVPPLQAAITEEVTPQTAPPPPPSTTAARAPHHVDFDRVRHVLAQLAEGLAFLHGRGVIHRDVKPSNAIVCDGTVKLLDFGLALDRTRGDSELSRETRVVGTAAYLAPEYVERLAISPAMDLYALGVLAFELATGAPPFGGTLHLLAHAHRALVLPRARAINPALPEDLDALIADLLAPDPTRRPSALAVATRLTGGLSQPAQTHRDAPFVGRTAELARLAARIDGTALPFGSADGRGQAAPIDGTALPFGSADGRGQAAPIDGPAPRGRLVLVRGPSGAGKSALLEAALRGVEPATTLVWRGRCHERERVPYRAFDLLVDDLATELEGDPRLATEIAHAGALGRVFPALAELLSGSSPDIVPAAADLRVERERALIAMTQLFGRLLRTPRGVLVIDDLQWADDDSLELLALLVERVDRPLTVLASTTADAGAPLPAITALLERLGAAAETIELPAMAARELAEVIAQLAPRVPIARIEAAAQRAAGSPYLAELIGRELGDASAELGDTADAETRRLGRLASTERAVAEVVALAGGTASFEQLRAVATLPSERLQSALRGLEDARIVRATPAATGDAVFAFYHSRLREAAEAAIAPDERRAVHRRFATWFETGASRAASAADATHAAALSWHWERAGEPVLARRWALTAAETARAQLAWGVAADWYARALALGADPLVARAGLADAQFLAGKLTEAARELLVLAELDTVGADRWRVRAAEAYLKLGEIDRSLALLDGVLARRGQPRARSRTASAFRTATVAVRWLWPRPAARQPVDDVLAGAYRVIASFLSTPYPVESFEYVLRAVDLAERTGDQSAHSTGMAMIAAYLAAGTLGRFGDRAIARAERLATDGGAPYARMVAAGAAGILATLRGDWLAMRGAHGAGEEICKRLGLERSWEASFLRTYWALGELYAGEPVRALALLADVRDASDDLFSRAMLGSFRGRALVVAGDLEAARVLEAELERTPAARHGMAAIYHQVFAGELALAEHAWPRALEIAHALQRSARAQWLSTMPAIVAMIEVIVATAEVGLALGGVRGSAARARAAARSLHRRSKSSFYAATALRLWSQAEDALGHRDRARTLLARAAAVAAERGGQVDRLAIAALGASGGAGATIGGGPLAAAVAWCTGGAVRVR